MGKTPRLEVSCGFLLGLTALAMALGGAHAESAFGTVGSAIALALAAVKARIVLAEYLHLRAVPAWLAGFSSALVVLVVILITLALIA
jgi:heme/copper-type cytochrome/quinol oxidase subunit 4